jgi:peroxiredoxin
MKRIFAFYLFILILRSGVNAQTDDILIRIIKNLANTNSYKCDCIYSFDFPLDLEIHNTMVLLRSPNDTAIGFNYHFYRDKTLDIKEGEADFYIYNFDAYYSSYKGNISEKVKKLNPTLFMDSIMGDGYVRPSIAKSPGLYCVTLFEIEKVLEQSNHNSGVTINHKPDTTFNSRPCFYYELNKKIKNNVLTTTIFFDKQTFYPLFYKVIVNSPMGKQTRTAVFHNIEGNPFVPNDYFLKENLLPQTKITINTNDSYKNMIGQKAPIWELPLLENGKKISLSQLSGKYVLLEFTATWCSHCWEAAKMMNRLEEKFKGNGSIALISIYSSGIDTKDRIANFAKKNEIKTKILYDAKSTGNDYHVEGYPQFFIVDPKGKIIFQFVGYSTDVDDIIYDKLMKYL